MAKSEQTDISQTDCLCCLATDERHLCNSKPNLKNLLRRDSWQETRINRGQLSTTYLSVLLTKVLQLFKQLSTFLFFANKLLPRYGLVNK